MNDEAAKAVLGYFEIDPIGQLLGSPYLRFQSPFGIDGLAKWNGDRLDILAVHASDRGTGQFRRFIRAAQERFKTVCVWFDIEPLVGVALVRYGFRRVAESAEDGERLIGWRWDREIKERS